jgi:predicted anti-sigma-YlaC factor YlaD
MNCRELSDFLMDYYNGDLPEESRVQFEMHLSKCGNCETYFVQYQLTIKAGKMACDETSDHIKAVPEDLIKAVLAARAKA